MNNTFGLTDKYGRKINYLRISITDRCNLRCTYCMPSDGIPLINHSDVLSYEEITKISYLAYELGFTKFRITGGEPLVRKGVSRLVANISGFGKGIDLSLTTNGVLLSKYAKDLKSAGLQRINISLDTMNKEKFKRISRFDLYQDVIDGIGSAIEVGFDPIKINVVMVRSFNYDEILDFVEMTKDKSLWVRFIELMPFSRSEYSIEDFVSADEMKARIEDHYSLMAIGEADSSAPARDYFVKGHKGQIGFIAPISKKFCDHCNRLRLTADGRLLPCLMSEIEIDIKTLMRKGASDDELKNMIRSAMQKKPKEHKLCTDEKVGRAMSRVGG